MATMWKQQLYAFLLRRVLSPILSAESNRKLHNVIDISFQEGRFVITDVELNPSFFESSGLHVLSTVLKRLEIQLSLEEEGASSSSSLAWRALQLAGAVNQGQPTVSLNANVWIDQLEIRLQAAPMKQRRASHHDGGNSSPSTQTSSTQASFLTSYVEAALSSLRLSVRMTNTRVRVEHEDGWLESCVKQIIYEDRVFDEMAAFHKHLVVVNVSAATRSGVDSPRPLILLDGSIDVKWRLLGDSSEHDSATATHLDSSIVRSETLQSEPLLKHDIAISMKQTLHISSEKESLLRIQSIAQCFSEDVVEEVVVEEMSASTQSRVVSDDTTDRDFEIIDGLMKQYQVAKLLAERKEIRGGILVPCLDPNNPDRLTFDAFFDANEFSVSRYSSFLKESLCLGGEVNKTAPDDWIHTSIRCHLDGGNVKVSFFNDKAHEEYLLLSFSGLNVEADFRRDQKDIRLRIKQLEIEDAHRVYDDGHADLEITSFLRFCARVTEFSPLYDIREEEEPCIDLILKTSENYSLTDRIDIEASFAAMETSLHLPTLLNCQALSHDVLKGSDQSVNASASGGESIILSEETNSSFVLDFYIKIEGIDLSVPLARDNDEWITLYQRSGYTVDSTMARKPAIGLALDQLLVEGSLGKMESCDETTITARSAIVFATSPMTKDSFDAMNRRVDICSFCGRTEVEPCIPISLRIISRTNDEVSSQLVSRIFPKVVDISSFKARQAEDNASDPCLSPNPEDEMFERASSSRSAVFVFIPEFLLDIAADEFRVLQEMANSIASFNHKPNPRDDRTANQISTHREKRSSQQPISILIDFDFIYMLLRGEEENDSFCVSFSAERLKCHLASLSDWLLQFRLILHNFTFSEGNKNCCSLENVPPTRRRSLPSAESRRLRMRQRILNDARIKWNPIFHRSCLFEAISKQTPAILIDFVNDVPGNAESLQGRKFHVTLYDTTYRLDFDPTWLTELNSLLKDVFGDLQNAQATDRNLPQRKVLTRAFFSVVDLNVDYRASPRFPTASRTMLRIGDFRFSSNVVVPFRDVQVVKFSLGDVSVLLSNMPFPYCYENNFLNQSLIMMEDDMKSLNEFGVMDTSDSKSVYQAMNMKTVITLDTLEGSVTFNQRESVEPSLRVDITAGEICLFACKDTFTCLVGTISEIATELTAVTTEDMDSLRSMSTKTTSIVSSTTEKEESSKPEIDTMANLRERSALRPAFGCPVVDQTSNQSGFLLDGYDWTTIDSDETGVAPTIPTDEEQSARWYSSNGSCEEDTMLISNDLREGDFPGPTIVADHFIMNSVSNPMEQGDMGISNYVGSSVEAKVHQRVHIHDLALRMRLFDGYDWPKSVKYPAMKDMSKRNFVIPEISSEEADIESEEDQKPVKDSKAALLEGLLGEETSTFRNEPLPEERAIQIKQNAQLQQLARRTNSYLQFYAGGISARIDSLQQSLEHRLASCLKLRMQDFFLAETISSRRPVKMIGEWFNEDEHPRDSNEGLLSMKVVTWHPEIRVNLANEIGSSECEAVLKLLPLRCLLDQRAIAFARAFFNDECPKPKQKLMKGLHQVPPPIYTMFRVLPLKLKVDYWPQRLNPKALRDGAIVELINISPLDGMVLTLKQVEITNEIGIGAALSILVSRWVKDICSTQLLQFVTKARPLEPITQLSGAATDMIVLPWEAFQNGESVRKALRSGIQGLSKTIAYELLTISSKTAQFLAGNASRMSLPPSAAGDFLPSRPLNVPRGVLETAPHALESLNRGIQAANYRIVIVPYKEYHRNGTTGAMKSVIRGIPVALAAPASGAAEALSFALIGVRNQVRPDIRREEEASAKGLDR